MAVLHFFVSITRGQPFSVAQTRCMKVSLSSCMVLIDMPVLPAISFTENQASCSTSHYSSDVCLGNICFRPTKVGIIVNRTDPF